MVVSEELIELTGKSLGAESKRILVTGATGFVGARLADVLVKAGHEVTITARSPYRVRSAGEFIAADIGDSKQVAELCKEKEVVIHSAAWTSPWGSLKKHRKINTLGTKNVVEGCKSAGVQRLVHVSTTAIHFEFKDKLQLKDDAPFPKTFCCNYAQSKAEAETLVQNEIASGLNAYIVRARAVFGPGDNALLPRLIQVAQQGGLRQIGNGKNLCDLTYVDNLVAGLILAANPDAPHGLCTITNEEPVVLWETLDQVLLEITGKPSAKKVPYGLAALIARLSEWKHAILNRPGEPPITRYGVGLLAKNQTFESPAASEDLGYKPLVSMNEGIDRTITDLQTRIKSPSKNQTRVEVQFFSTGFIEFKHRMAVRSADRSLTRFHATFALIRHPSFGVTLFDTGYSPAFFEATQKMPYRLYRYTTKVHTNEAWRASQWISRQGIEPDEVDRIVISHFHGDHICGLDEFPSADFVTSQKAWEAIRLKKGFGAVKRAFLPDLLPPDFESRLHLVGPFHSPGIGPLSRCHDLFRDGSVRLFELGGHADGQIGMLLQVADGRQLFLIADAFWSEREIREKLKPTLGFRFVADDFRAASESRNAIVEIGDAHPEIEFVCCHCPEFAQRERFDQQLDSIGK